MQDTPTTRLTFEQILKKSKTEYDRDGVAVVPGVFTKDEMDDLRRMAWKNFRMADEKNIQWFGNSPALLFGPHMLQTWVEDKRLRAIVKHFVGERVFQLNNQLYFRLPGDGDQFGWHQDICFRIPREKFAGVEQSYLQTAIIVDPIDSDNSPIEFVLGSHRGPELELVPRDGSEKGLRAYTKDFFGVPYLACSGDVLVWSAMTVHGSRPNRSHKSRMYFMNGFAHQDHVLDKTMFPEYWIGDA